MSTTTITGTINGVNNTALANKWITFRLVQLGTDSVATATVAQSVDSVQTDANGDFSIGVWNNGDSGKPSVLEITIDGSKPESVIIPTATATIELWDLIENYQADGSTSEQVPTVSALFLRKSNNLSDLGSATTSRTNLGVPSIAEAVLVANNLSEVDPATARANLGVPSTIEGLAAANNLSELTPTSSTARTNLGVAIGSNVQAHSAVLDATTASFTTAEESKLSGIEALAEVNDPTTVLDADIGSTVQAYSAILDATTASFTTAKDTAISTNTANIALNDTDIATNVTNIATNATAIALNTAVLSGYSPIAIIADATTARSLSLTDIGAYIRLTNASSCTITIPANATVDWAGETVPPTIYVRVAAAGIPTLSNAGVTINDPLGVIAALAEGSNFELQWVASDVWDII